MIPFHAKSAINGFSFPSQVTLENASCLKLAVLENRVQESYSWRSRKWTNH
jgi:hypothetical protein